MYWFAIYRCNDEAYFILIQGLEKNGDFSVPKQEV